MTCQTCAHALMRSESPHKHWNYECCSLGLISMMPTLPETDHDCRMWAPGKAKQQQGIEIIYGEDMEYGQTY